MKKESTSATIRLAEQSDAQAIAEMSRDFIESGLGWRYDPTSIQRALRRRETTVLVASERPTYVARERPALSGFAIMDYGDERAHLVLLAVRPVCQRRGIARRLVQWLLQSAAAAGIASIHVELRAQNQAAYGLYRTLGFGETLRLPGYYRGRETAVRMMRVLRVNDPALPPWRPPKRWA